jgi:hypothetical protein
MVLIYTMLHKKKSKIQTADIKCLINITQKKYEKITNRTDKCQKFMSTRSFSNENTIVLSDTPRYAISKVPKNPCLIIKERPRLKQ